MNLDFNLLPDEYRARPPIDAKTLLLVVLVLVLIGGAFFLFQSKSTVDGEIEDLNTSIATINKQIAQLSQNPEVEQLEARIAQLETQKAYYPAFVDARILWGNTVQSVYYDTRPGEVAINSLSQKSNILTINGVTEDYTYITSYAKVLNDMPQFILDYGPSYSASGAYSMRIKVAGGEVE